MVYYQQSCQCSVYKFDCKTEHNTTRYKNNWQYKTQWNSHWLERNKRGGVKMWFSWEYSKTCWNIHLKRQCHVLDAIFKMSLFVVLNKILPYYYDLAESHWIEILY